MKGQVLGSQPWSSSPGYGSWSGIYSLFSSSHGAQVQSGAHSGPQSVVHGSQSGRHSSEGLHCAVESVIAVTRVMDAPVLETVWKVFVDFIMTSFLSIIFQTSA